MEHLANEEAVGVAESPCGGHGSACEAAVHDQELEDEPARVGRRNEPGGRQVAQGVVDAVGAKAGGRPVRLVVVLVSPIQA